MTRLPRTLAALLVAVLPLFAAAAPAVAQQQELPRVLILGDGLYNTLTGTIGKELKGRAVVVTRHPGDSSSAVDRLDELLGTDAWDVILVNFGLADLHYRDPATKAIRAMSKHAGGVRVTSLERYEKNLRLLIPRLKATGAAILWANTTPVGSTQLDHLYDAGSEVAYNAAAAKVMAEHDIPVSDLHAFVVAKLGEKKLRDPFTLAREVPLHEPVLEAIRTGLAGRPSEAPTE